MIIAVIGDNNCDTFIKTFSDTIAMQRKFENIDTYFYANSVGLEINEIKLK